ncbi:MAG: hypothetical protein QUS35_03715, partial [bacterium]|nr:hypothetical protein [bacterium]
MRIMYTPDGRPEPSNVTSYSPAGRRPEIGEATSLPVTSNTRSSTRPVVRRPYRMTAVSYTHLRAHET